ncbi:FadR/GntR family transcriptional regulator [Clostridium sp. E02]|uniref:FadR/GntR family transcriptional regulator n=1 Tax=Clostridium sp. E02 TaxID=2487134 RepID=UPI000F523770|nr:FadR/GntR family transcriptional regulator [Clostridium sp. E02]
MIEDLEYNKRNNLLTLRRYLQLTQKEFIKQYFSGMDGKNQISLSTLSNLETKGGTRLNDVLEQISSQLDFDTSVFQISTDKFMNDLENLVPKDRNIAKNQEETITSKNTNVNVLLNRLTNYFADEFFSGRLNPGDKIESDRNLAEIFQVGRSAIREALKVLDVLGLIEIRPGQGSFLCNDGSNFFMIPLSWSLFLNTGQVESILDVRYALEVKAAGMSASHAQSKNLEELNDIFFRMYNAYHDQDYDVFLELDMEFHLIVSKCSGNEVIYQLIRTIINFMRNVSSSGMANMEQLQCIYDEHQKIYGFIIAHDEEGAENAMREHLQAAKKRYNFQ